MLDAILMIVSALMIILSLLQSGKTDGMSGAFTGNGGLNLFANVKKSAMPILKGRSMSTPVFPIWKRNLKRCKRSQIVQQAAEDVTTKLWVSFPKS